MTKEVLRCNGCNAQSYSNGKCNYCGNDETVAPEPKKEIKETKLPKQTTMNMKMCTIDIIKNTRLVGKMNTIEKAINCTIEGKMNTIQYAENCIIKGKMNTIVVAKNVTVLGKMNTILERR